MRGNNRRKGLEEQKGGLLFETEYHGGYKIGINFPTGL